MISKRNRRIVLCLVSVSVLCASCALTKEWANGSRVIGTLEVELGSKSGVDDAMCSSNLD
jgi:hypothetical protein